MADVPVRLDGYCFLKTVVEENGKYDPQANDTVGSFPLRSEFGKHKEDDRKYQIRIVIEPPKNQENTLPYKIAVEVAGLFTVSADFEHPDIDSLVFVNGASMLYSAAREHILAITARGRLGPYQLPTVNLRDHLPTETERQEAPN